MRAARPPLPDLLFAGVLAVLSVVELRLDYAFERTTEPGPVAWHFVVAAGAALALAWRRTYPASVAVGVTVAFGSEPFLVAPTNVYLAPIVAGVATYSLAVHASSWRRVVPAAAVMLVALICGGSQDPEDPFGTAATAVIATLLLLAVGTVVRRYRERTDSMRSERDRAEAHARAVAAQERARIARELHDVVAHGMSVVVLQAVGGRRMLEADPRQARDAFDAIERVSGQCLSEMRRLLGILREHDEEVPLTPQPRLSDLQALVEQAQDTGVDIQLTVSGERTELAPAIELSAYRIAQEAVTNALKHAAGSRVRLAVHYRPDRLVVEVDDDATTAPEPDGSGHGLIGMRERAELFGGTFCAGPRPEGGFGVHAELPLAGGGGA